MRSWVRSLWRAQTLQSLNDGQLNASSGALGPTFSTSSFCLARLPLVEPMSSASGQEGKRFVLCILQTDGSPEVDRAPLFRAFGDSNSMNCAFSGLLRAVSAQFSRQWAPSKRLGTPRNASERLETPRNSLLFCPRNFWAERGKSREKGAFSTSLLVQNVFKTSENRTNRVENICFDTF